MGVYDALVYPKWDKHTSNVCIKLYLSWSCEGILPTVRRSNEEFLECVLFTATSVLEAVEFLREQLFPLLPVVDVFTRIYIH